MSTTTYTEVFSHRQLKSDGTWYEITLIVDVIGSHRAGGLAELHLTLNNHSALLLFPQPPHVVHPTEIPSVWTHTRTLRLNILTYSPFGIMTYISAIIEILPHSYFHHSFHPPSINPLFSIEILILHSQHQSH